MGNKIVHRRKSAIGTPRSIARKESLVNQTFCIEGQFYTLCENLNNGAFASVWTSTTPEGYRAAVKMFDFSITKHGLPKNVLMLSYAQEVKMALKIRNVERHVVTIYGFAYDPARNFASIAMELGEDNLEVRVKDLHKIYETSKMINKDYISSIDRKNIWIQLVEIILVLHRYNIIHRDIKPRNLVFFGSILKITDFGIAEDANAECTALKAFGSYGFSAPESCLIEANVTSKADIWSAGAILYYLTYGNVPLYPSPTCPIGSLPTRSTLVRDILHNCLVIDPNQRQSHEWLAEHPLTITDALE